MKAEDELIKSMDMLYSKTVPAGVRAFLDMKSGIGTDPVTKPIRKSKSSLSSAVGGSVCVDDTIRRFSVYHVSENGSDTYFTNDHFNTFRSAAYRYRLYDRDELSSEPQRLADAFIGNESITVADYEALCDRMPNDVRITALVDFDLDNETVGVCDSSDNAWRYYRLHDLSAAAFKAYRGEYKSADDRERIFENALSGKGIDLENELLAEIEPHTTQL